MADELDIPLLMQVASEQAGKKRKAAFNAIVNEAKGAHSSFAKNLNAVLSGHHAQLSQDRKSQELTQVDIRRRIALLDSEAKKTKAVKLVNAASYTKDCERFFDGWIKDLAAEMDALEGLANQQEGELGSSP